MKSSFLVNRKLLWRKVVWGMPVWFWKKFKFCCFEKARSAQKRSEPHSHNYTDGRLKNMLMNFWGDTDFRHYFISDDKCKGEIKSAHSIQNNRILNRISEDGHIYTIEATINHSEIEPEFKKISRNKANTFFVSVIITIQKYLSLLNWSLIKTHLNGTS